jgi:hypothetical protein
MGKIPISKWKDQAYVSLDEASMLTDIVNIFEAKMIVCRGVDDFSYSKDTITFDDRGYFEVKLFL